MSESRLDELVLAAIEHPKLCGQKYGAARAFVKEFFDISDSLKISRIVELSKSRVERARTVRCLAAHVAAVCSCAYCVYRKFISTNTTLVSDACNHVSPAIQPELFASMRAGAAVVRDSARANADQRAIPSRQDCKRRAPRALRRCGGARRTRRRGV